MSSDVLPLHCLENQRQRSSVINLKHMFHLFNQRIFFLSTYQSRCLVYVKDLLEQGSVFLKLEILFFFLKKTTFIKYFIEFLPECEV